MPVPMKSSLKKKKFWARERKKIYDKAFEAEKINQLKVKHAKRVKEIQDEAKAKAQWKYGTTRKERMGKRLVKMGKKVEGMQKAIERGQKQLENDLKNMRRYW